MNKYLKSFLLASFLIVGGTGVSSSANSINWDQIHEQAYKDSINASNTKTQKDINKARESIKIYSNTILETGKESFQTNVNTFSEIVDKVQHPILVNIINSIKGMQLKASKGQDVTQSEINSARRLCINNVQDTTDDIPKVYYAKGWSQEIDNMQELLINKIVKLVKIAEIEKTQKSIDSANVYINDMKTAIVPQMVEWANAMALRLSNVIISPNPPIEKPNPPVEPPIEKPNPPVEPPIEKPNPPVEPPVEKPNPPVENKVVFNDNILEDVVRKFINKPTGDILVSDVENITTFNANTKGIKDITGLEHFKNLEILSMVNWKDPNTSIYNEISDLSPLKGLSKLRILDLRDNNVTDISPLKGLPSLRDLTLAGNKLNEMTDLSILKTLPSLIDLDISFNGLVDISQLKNLINLISLDVDNNKIVDLSPIENLSNLKNLSIGRNPVIDLKPIYNLTKLEKLFLPGLDNSINFDFLLDYKNLKLLDVSYTDLTRSKIEILKQLKTLKSLSVYGNSNVMELIKELKEALPNCEIE